MKMVILLILKKKRGKVICINFWATWCAPFVAEMPSLQSLYDSYGDKVTFLFIANDEVETVDTFMQKRGYTLPIYYVDNEVPTALEHSSIPTTYWIDKSGRIVIKKGYILKYD